MTRKYANGGPICAKCGRRRHGTAIAQRMISALSTTAATSTGDVSPSGGSGKAMSASHIAPKKGAARASRPA